MFYINKSELIYWTDHNPSGTNWGSNASGVTFTDVTSVSSESLQSGSDGSTVTMVKRKLLMKSLVTAINGRCISIYCYR